MFGFIAVVVAAMLCCLAVLIIAGEIPGWVVATGLLIYAMALVAEIFQDQNPLQEG